MSGTGHILPTPGSRAWQATRGDAGDKLRPLWRDQLKKKTQPNELDVEGCPEPLGSQGSRRAAERVRNPPQEGSSTRGAALDVWTEPEWE